MQYLAKKNNITIEQHNNDLFNILDEIKDIYGIDNALFDNISTAIEYHDIGKVTSEYQAFFAGASNTNKFQIRHEILSATVTSLTDSQLYAIFTHHKTFFDILDRLDNSNFDNTFEEFKEIVDVEVDKGNLDRVQKWTKASFRMRNKDKIKEFSKVKGYLQLCDHLASAGVCKINKGLNLKTLFKFTKYRSIQQQAMSVKNDCMIIARTGGGKTEASLFFANAVQNEGKSRRIYYVLPYTASINAMYMRMKSKTDNVAMLHGKALNFMYKELDSLDILHTYSLFKKSINQLNISTIFQLIKSVHNDKYSEMLSCMQENSIFIFDEIHCFENELLAFMVAYMEYLKFEKRANICIMTASMHSKLKNVICKRLGIESTLSMSEKENEIKRHRIGFRDTNILHLISEINDKISKGTKVLIVANTVKRSQEIFSLIKTERKLLLHSRFAQIDRDEIERKIKENEHNREYDVMIGTQTVEVSLDIDYDEMYTELCPFDCLLQRMGRVFRNRILNSEKQNVTVVNNDNNARTVYDEEMLLRTKEIVKRIEGNIVNENEITSYLDFVYSGFNEKEFESKIQMYKRYIDNSLSNILTADKKKVVDENSFYKQDGKETISVIVEKYQEAYKQCIDNKQYVKANDYIINLSMYENVKNKHIAKGDLSVLCEKNNVFFTNFEYSEEGLKIKRQ